MPDSRLHWSSSEDVDFRSHDFGEFSAFFCLDKRILRYKVPRIWQGIHPDSVQAFSYSQAGVL